MSYNKEHTKIGGGQYMIKIKARILKMTKDDMTICSARCIWATLLDEQSNKEYRVAWAQTPTVIGVTGTWRSKAQHVFEKSWDKCNVGDEVWLYHPSDSNFNYFEPMK
jgi:hypothetical protein